MGGPLTGKDAFDRGIVQVRIAQYPGPGEAHAVNQAGMAELVGHNQIVSAGKRGQNAQVDVIAGVEEQRGLAVVKAGQLFLETGAGGIISVL